MADAPGGGRAAEEERASCLLKRSRGAHGAKRSLSASALDEETAGTSSPEEEDNATPETALRVIDNIVLACDEGGWEEMDHSHLTHVVARAPSFSKLGLGKKKRPSRLWMLIDLRGRRNNAVLRKLTRCLLACALAVALAVVLVLLVLTATGAREYDMSLVRQLGSRDPDPRAAQEKDEAVSKGVARDIQDYLELAFAHEEEVVRNEELQRAERDWLAGAADEEERASSQLEATMKDMRNEALLAWHTHETNQKPQLRDMEKRLSELRANASQPVVAFTAVGPSPKASQHDRSDWLSPLAASVLQKAGNAKANETGRMARGAGVMRIAGIGSAKSMHMKLSVVAAHNGDNGEAMASMLEADCAFLAFRDFGGHPSSQPVVGMLAALPAYSAWRVVTPNPGTAAPFVNGHLFAALETEMLSDPELFVRSHPKVAVVFGGGTAEDDALWRAARHGLRRLRAAYQGVEGGACRFTVATIVADPAHFPTSGGGMSGESRWLSALIGAVPSAKADDEHAKRDKLGAESIEAVEVDYDFLGLAHRLEESILMLGAIAGMADEELQWDGAASLVVTPRNLKNATRAEMHGWPGSEEAESRMAPGHGTSRGDGGVAGSMYDAICGTFTQQHQILSGPRQLGVSMRLHFFDVKSKRAQWSRMTAHAQTRLFGYDAGPFSEATHRKPAIAPGGVAGDSTANSLKFWRKSDVAVDTDSNNNNEMRTARRSNLIRPRILGGVMDEQGCTVEVAARWAVATSGDDGGGGGGGRGATSEEGWPSDVSLAGGARLVDSRCLAFKTLRDAMQRHRENYILATASEKSIGDRLLRMQKQTSVAGRVPWDAVELDDDARNRTEAAAAGSKEMASVFSLYDVVPCAESSCVRYCFVCADEKKKHPLSQLSSYTPGEQRRCLRNPLLDARYVRIDYGCYDTATPLPVCGGGSTKDTLRGAEADDELGRTTGQGAVHVVGVEDEVKGAGMLANCAHVMVIR